MDEMRKWPALHNLSQIGYFHNNLRVCLRQALAATEIDGSTSVAPDKALIHYYDSLLRINTFLMLYLHTEEWLDILIKKYLPHITINRGGSITRYKSAIRDGFGIGVSGGSWHMLTDCEKLRNCLLHANGRIDLMENESEIRQIAKRRGIDVKLDRLQVTSNFLATFAKEVDAFINELQNRA